MTDTVPNQDPNLKKPTVIITDHYNSAKNKAKNPIPPTKNVARTAPNDGAAAPSYSSAPSSSPLSAGSAGRAFCLVVTVGWLLLSVVVMMTLVVRRLVGATVVVG